MPFRSQLEVTHVITVILVTFAVGGTLLIMLVPKFARTLCVWVRRRQFALSSLAHYDMS